MSLQVHRVGGHVARVTSKPACTLLRHVCLKSVCPAQGSVPSERAEVFARSALGPGVSLREVTQPCEGGRSPVGMTRPHSGSSFAPPVPVPAPTLHLLSALPLALISTLLPVELLL